ncbi:hypothetical protein F503_04024 [Ophiostoma piceae UAMH 11346]|uniref:Uncharacterized protein n=1 Tax=Ophiostoma piceae (strain UAMH 11346) TaxID=1262450 RepID=S3CQ06_OPHP1|nr:hypothetical protein F503_04024 [Ophiostoma piceae UAMH 11346]
MCQFNTTDFPSTSPRVLMTTLTSISRPPSTVLSLLFMSRPCSETAYISGPMTVYAGTMTETVILMGTIENRRTSYNDKSTTLHAMSTVIWGLMPTTATADRLY